MYAHRLAIGLPRCNHVQLKRTAPNHCCSHAHPSMNSRTGNSLALVWLRNNLRLADNEALLVASKCNASQLLIYYALDPALLRPRTAVPGHLELISKLPTLGPYQCRRVVYCRTILIAHLLLLKPQLCTQHLLYSTINFQCLSSCLRNSFILDALRELLGQLKASHGVPLHFSIDAPADATRAIVAAALRGNQYRHVDFYHCSEATPEAAQHEVTSLSKCRWPGKAVLHVKR